MCNECSQRFDKLFQLRQTPLSHASLCCVKLLLAKKNIVVRSREAVRSTSTPRGELKSSWDVRACLGPETRKRGHTGGARNDFETALRRDAIAAQTSFGASTLRASLNPLRGRSRASHRKTSSAFPSEFLFSPSPPSTSPISTSFLYPVLCIFLYPLNSRVC